MILFGSPEVNFVTFFIDKLNVAYCCTGILAHNMFDFIGYRPTEESNKMKEKQSDENFVCYNTRHV